MQYIQLFCSSLSCQWTLLLLCLQNMTSWVCVKHPCRSSPGLFPTTLPHSPVSSMWISSAVYFNLPLRMFIGFVWSFFSPCALWRHEFEDHIFPAMWLAVRITLSTVTSSTWCESLHEILSKPTECAQSQGAAMQVMNGCCCYAARVIWFLIGLDSGSTSAFWPFSAAGLKSIKECCLDVL